MLHDDAVEEAAITSAQRIQRPPSRAPLTANVIKQRASSTRSISSARTGEHNRSPSLSNITSPGFVNMISSNGNSWTDPSVDVTEIHRLSTISGDDIGEVSPLALRSGNANKQKALVIDNEKLAKSSQPLVNSQQLITAAERVCVSPQRVAMSAVRTGKVSQPEVNAPKPSTLNRSRQTSAASKVQPMLRRQTSILSLR